MAAQKKKTNAGETIPCPTCGGQGVVAGARYTDPETVCPSCKGAGVAPKHATVADEAA